MGRRLATVAFSLAVGIGLLFLGIRLLQAPEVDLGAVENLPTGAILIQFDPQSRALWQQPGWDTAVKSLPVLTAATSFGQTGTVSGCTVPDSATSIAFGSDYVTVIPEGKTEDVPELQSVQAALSAAIARNSVPGSTVEPQTTPVRIDRGASVVLRIPRSGVSGEKRAAISLVPDYLSAPSHQYYRWDAQGVVQVAKRVVTPQVWGGVVIPNRTQANAFTHCLQDALKGKSQVQIQGDHVLWLPMTPSTSTVASDQVASLLTRWQGLDAHPVFSGLLGGTIAFTAHRDNTSLLIRTEGIPGTRDPQDVSSALPSLLQVPASADFVLAGRSNVVPELANLASDLIGQPESSPSDVQATIGDVAVSMGPGSTARVIADIRDKSILTQLRTTATASTASTARPTGTVSPSTTQTPSPNPSLGATSPSTLFLQWSDAQDIRLSVQNSETTLRLPVGVPDEWSLTAEQAQVRGSARLETDASDLVYRINEAANDDSVGSFTQSETYQNAVHAMGAQPEALFYINGKLLDRQNFAWILGGLLKSSSNQLQGVLILHW